MNIQHLDGIIPDHITRELTPEFLVKACIDGPKRLSNFLGQLMEECANFSRMVENLNYSAKGLAKTWPSRYAVDPKADVKEPNKLALKLQNDPVAIANNCYCDRNGNGNEESGDGYKFRGRGPNMITGRGTYQAFENWLKKEGFDFDIMHNPDLVAKDTTVGLLSAVWFFSIFKNLWPICDKGVDVETIKDVTRKVNGGLTNIESRIAYTQKIYKAVTA